MDSLMPSTSDLAARMETLERQNRRFRLGMVVAVAVAGCCLLIAADDAKLGTVTADRFVLLDKDGKTRAALEMGATGPRLVLKNEEETDRATLGIAPSGNPVLSLMNEQGTERAVLEVNKDGYPLLSLNGDDRKLVSYVAENEQGFVFADRNAARIQMFTDKAGDGLLLFRDGQKRPRSLISGYGADSGLIIYDPAGKQRLKMILDRGEPNLSIVDAAGKPVFAQPAPAETKEAAPPEEEKKED